MQNYEGPIRKLIGVFKSPIDYYFPIGEDKIYLNGLLGKKISLEFLGNIFCIHCNRKTSKSFQQGYCYPCYCKLLECNLCIIHPEKCNYPHTDCPDTWQHAHCKQEHIVYLANSSGLKIGITRLSQLPTRWIDQGASQAIALFKVANRYHSGILEVLFKQFVQDKTNWRKMLKGSYEIVDMSNAKQNLLEKANEALIEVYKQHEGIELLQEEIHSFSYPILTHPQQCLALSLDKKQKVEGTLLGIKGQYLLLDSGVLNIRKHSGYSLSFGVID
jgi:hypothetical protein